MGRRGENKKGRKGDGEMGRNFLILILFIFLSSFWGCGGETSKTRTQNVKPLQTVTPVTAPSIPKDGIYNGRGEVTKINNELGSIELKHEDIKVMMPAMQMEFFVKDKALLKGLAVGDTVDFAVEYTHPTEVIIGIKKAK